MSIMTSMYPSVNNVMDDRSQLDPLRTTLAEVLRKAGYRTVGMVSHTFVDRRFGFGRGFEVYEDKKLIERPAEEITDMAMSLIEPLRNEPFFLFVHYFDPHFPYDPPPPFDPPAEDEDREPERPLTWTEMKRFAFEDYTIPPDQLERMIDLYDGEIAYTDAMIGRLVENLRSAGIYDRSTIVLTADHGEEFKEHGSMGHTRTLYDEILHVPLLVKLPGSAGAGTVVGQQVRSIDIAPTILRLAGLNPPLEYQGVDLSPFWREGGTQPDLPAFSETSRHAILRSVRDTGYKYIQNIRRSFYLGTASGIGSSEVYCLREDRGERNELSKSKEGEILLLRKELFDWVRHSELERRWIPKAGGTEEITYDKETLDRLRALGYVQ